MPKNTEIERKFKIDRFPEGLELVDSRIVDQRYLSVDPEVRIRRVKYQDGIRNYWLTIKSKGTLKRTEVEFDMTFDQYKALALTIPYPAIRKELNIYRLPDGHLLECNRVDGDTENEYWYAEVEFEDEASAKAFQPPEFLGEDITEDDSYKMSNVWKSTRLCSNRKISAVRLDPQSDDYIQIIVTYDDGFEQNLFKYHPEDIPDIDPAKFLGLTRKEALEVYCPN